jgi:putative ABC transport system permease protein
VRRALGATRAQLILQFLCETVLTALFAMVLAVAIVELLLPAFGALTGVELHLSDFGEARLAAYALCIAVLAGLVAGAYPAFYLSAFEPAKVVKGDVTGAAAGAAFRNALVASLVAGLLPTWRACQVTPALQLKSQ